MRHNDQHSKTPWISGAFLAAVVIAGAGVVIATSSRGHSTPRAETSATASPSFTARSCPTDTSQTAPPAGPPAGLSWRPLSGQTPTQLPYGGDRYGPCHPTATVATGYAHTPVGALIAATQIMIRSSASGPIGMQTIQRQVAGGPWKQKMLDNLSGQTADPNAAGAGITAYAINSYTPEACDVSVAIHYPAPPNDLVFRINVQWDDGDWKMLAPVGGDWSAAVSQPTTLDGFVSWGPRRS
jgi:hypothetical protein